MWKMTIAFTLLEQTCLTKQANKTLPPHTNAVKIANDMGDYFVQKITAIRSKMAASTQSPPPPVLPKNLIILPPWKWLTFLSLNWRY